jgi:carbamate kinase
VNGGRDPRLWVVAIGGNALANPHDPLALAGQDQEAAALAVPLVDAIARGMRLVIVHGNGPQVGARLIQNEAARDQVPASPLHVCVAETQGQMGHHLALALEDGLGCRGVERRVACVITHVVVDPRAREFESPEKPVGPVYGPGEAERLAAAHVWVMREVAGGGLRRVVASPRPLGIIEEAAIRCLVDAGVCVIAGGGGGVPVAEGPGGLRGVDAVVDKDYTAELLATLLGASRLVVLTDVPGAALSFGQSGERFMGEMAVAEARRHLEAGEFAPGSMAPKVEACVEFIEAGGEVAIIASTGEAASALAGDAGTRIKAG